MSNHFKRSRLLYISIFILFYLSGNASNPANSLFVPCQDSTYFTHQDTIFITLGTDLEKFVLHTMQPKQTLFSLAQFFGLHTNDLYDYNIELGEKITMVGSVLHIPIPNSAITRFRGNNFYPSDYIPVVYKVRKGETLYRIAKKYFRMPVEAIQNRNNLPDYFIQEGQHLHIGWMSRKGLSKNSYRKKGAKTNYVLSKFLKDYSHKKIQEETGVGAWQKNSSLSSGLYALHNKAAMNSEIAVTNPMSKRTVIVKVIGRIPPAAYSKDEKIVLSSQAAKTLWAKDARFLVNIHYRKR